MQPYEKFTERAKKALVLAQQEAEQAKHGYIGSEHLLLALLAVREGVAAKVLAGLGVEEGQLRRRFEEVLGRPEPPAGVEQTVPTARVKKAIELAFDQSRRMGHLYVGTEHLLLGLLAEGGSIAALALQELGATEEKVRAEMERLLREGAIPAPITGVQTDTPFLSLQLGSLLERARQLAAQEGSAATRLEHLLRSLLDEPALAELVAVLDRHGVQWRPPEELLRLAARLHEVRLQRAEALRQQQEDMASTLGKEEIRLRNELMNAERAWLRRTSQDQPPA